MPDTADATRDDPEQTLKLKGNRESFDGAGFRGDDRSRIRDSRDLSDLRDRRDIKGSYCPSCPLGRLGPAVPDAGSIVILAILHWTIGAYDIHVL